METGLIADKQEDVLTEDQKIKKSIAAFAARILYLKPDDKVKSECKRVIAEWRAIAPRDEKIFAWFYDWLNGFNS